MWSEFCRHEKQRAENDHNALKRGVCKQTLGGVRAARLPEAGSLGLRNTNLDY